MKLHKPCVVMRGSRKNVLILDVDVFGCRLLWWGYLGVTIIRSLRHPSSQIHKTHQICYATSSRFSILPTVPPDDQLLANFTQRIIVVITRSPYSSCVNQSQDTPSRRPFGSRLT